MGSDIGFSDRAPLLDAEDNAHQTVLLQLSVNDATAAQGEAIAVAGRGAKRSDGKLPPHVCAVAAGRFIRRLARWAYLVCSARLE